MKTNGQSENWVLSQLPSEMCELLVGRMQRIRVEMGEILFEQGGPVLFAYFPLSGMFSTLIVMANGSSAETATVGKEGLVGLQLLADMEASPSRVVAQVAGESWRIPADALRAAFRESAALRDLLFRYAIAFLQQANQNAACNRLHNLQQRLARWLLFTRDRVGGSEFAITQHFLAEMLGVHRPTVSTAAAGLQEAGMISYRRGRVSLLDPGALRATSCECYEVTKAIYDRLLRRPNGEALAPL